MANWQRKIDLQPEWNMTLDDIMPVQELAAVIAKRLSELEPLEDDVEYQKLNLIKKFEYLSTNPIATFEEFNYLMEQLFDWGDTSLDGRWNGKKVCWINVM